MIKFLLDTDLFWLILFIALVLFTLIPRDVQAGNKLQNIVILLLKCICFVPIFILSLLMFQDMSMVAQLFGEKKSDL